MAVTSLSVDYMVKMKLFQYLFKQYEIIRKGADNVFGNVPGEMKLSLKTTRELKGLKQSEAAKMIGVSTDTLGNYERGKSYPDIPVLRKIEKIYFFYH